MHQLILQSPEKVGLNRPSKHCTSMSIRENNSRHNGTRKNYFTRCPGSSPIMKLRILISEDLKAFFEECVKYIYGDIMLAILVKTQGVYGFCMYFGGQSG